MNNANAPENQKRKQPFSIWRFNTWEEGEQAGAVLMPRIVIQKLPEGGYAVKSFVGDAAIVLGRCNDKYGRIDYVYARDASAEERAAGAIALREFLRALKTFGVSLVASRIGSRQQLGLFSRVFGKRNLGRPYEELEMHMERNDNVPIEIVLAKKHDSASGKP